MGVVLLGFFCVCLFELTSCYSPLHKKNPGKTNPKSLTQASPCGICLLVEQLDKISNNQLKYGLSVEIINIKHKHYSHKLREYKAKILIAKPSIYVTETFQKPSFYFYGISNHFILPL